MNVAFGKIKITPKNYVGIPLAGYTPIPKCTGILDDIYAHGILIEDEDLGNVKRRVLLISLDLLKLALSFTNYVKEQIQKVHPIPPGQVLIHATHTHKGPDVTGEFDQPGGGARIVFNIICGHNTRDPYLVWVARQIVTLVGELLQNLVPCKMAWAREPPAHSNLASNRRGAPLPPPDVGVIAFRALTENNLLGFLMHFAAHGITVGRHVSKISADWMGFAVKRVAELTHGEVQAAYFNGPSGDVSPGVPHWLVPPPTKPFATRQERKAYYRHIFGYKRTEGIGNAVGEQALHLAQSIPVEQFLPKMTLRVYTKTIWIPVKDFKYWSKHWFENSPLQFLKRYLLIPIAVSHEKPNFPGFALKHTWRMMSGYTLLQWIRITASSTDNKISRELGIITAPGELFEEIGLRLRAKCPTGIKDTFLIQNANDWVSYLFPKHTYIESGGYEPYASLSPVCGHYYEREMRKLFREVAAGVNITYS